MIKQFGLTNVPGLQDLAEVVHDIDVKDGKFNRLEAAGLNAIIDGLSESLRDDRRLLQQSTAIFSGLFTAFGKQASKNQRKRIKARSRKGNRRR